MFPLGSNLFWRLRCISRTLLLGKNQDSTMPWYKIASEPKPQAEVMTYQFSLKRYLFNSEIVCPVTVGQQRKPKQRDPSPAAAPPMRNAAQHLLQSKVLVDILNASLMRNKQKKLDVVPVQVRPCMLISQYKIVIWKMRNTELLRENR